MTKSILGFVGLGAMGQNAARQLLLAGHRVQGFDLRPESLQTFASQGGEVVTTPAQAAAQAMGTVLFVVNAAQAEAVLFGADGLVGGAAPGHLGHQRRRTRRIADVADGTDSTYGGVPGYTAVKGYDMATGVGTLDAARSVPALAAVSRKH